MLQKIGKDQKVIKPWVIYLWRNGDKMEGAAPVVTKDGIKEVYCHGWEIEPDPLAKRNEDKHKEWRARVKVKNLLNNTLNVINWYGKTVLDGQGNIATYKLKSLEIQNAIKLSKTNYKLEEANKKLPKDKRQELMGLDDFYPIRKFPTEDITIEKAMEYGFIGDKIQNKFVNKHNG